MIGFWGTYQQFFSILICLIYILLAFLLVFFYRSQLKKEKTDLIVIFICCMGILWNINHIGYLMAYNVSIGLMHFVIEQILLIIYILIILITYIKLLSKDRHKIIYLTSSILYIISSLGLLWWPVTIYISSYSKALIMLFSLIVLVIYSHRNRNFSSNLISYQNIIENMEEIIVVFNNKGELIYNNSDMFGSIKTIEDVTDQYIGINKETVEYFKVIKDKVRHQKKVTRVFEMVIKVGSKTKVYDAYFYTYYNQYKKLEGYIMSFYDISDIKNLIGKSEKMSKELYLINDQLSQKQNTEREILREQIRYTIMESIRDMTLKEITNIMSQVEILSSSKMDESAIIKILASVRTSLSKVRGFVRKIN